MYSNRLRAVFVLMCLLMLAGSLATGYFGLNAYLHATPPGIGLLIGLGLLSLAFLCLRYISDPDSK